MMGQISAGSEACNLLMILEGLYDSSVVVMVSVALMDVMGWGADGGGLFKMGNYSFEALSSLMHSPWSAIASMALLGR